MMHERYAAVGLRFTEVSKDEEVMRILGLG